MEIALRLRPGRTPLQPSALSSILLPVSRELTIGFELHAVSCAAVLNK